MPPLPGLEGTGYWSTQGGEEDYCLTVLAEEGRLNKYTTALDQPGAVPVSLYGEPWHTQEELSVAARAAGILTANHGTVIPQIHNQQIRFK